MKRIHAVVALCAATMISCVEGTNGDGGEKSLVVADNSVLSQTLGFDATEGNSVKFTASGPWTSEVSQTRPQESEEVEWIEIAPDHGDEAGEYEMEIKLAPNRTGADREAKIDIFCGSDKITVNVTQQKEGVPSEGKITLSEGTKLTQTVSAVSTQGEGPIEFTTDGPWIATVMQQGNSAGAAADIAADEEFWISVSPDHGDAAGIYTMNITLQPNESPVDRAAIITIKCGEAEIEARITQEKAEAGEQPVARLLRNITEIHTDWGHEWKTSIDFKYDSQNRLSGFYTVSKNEDTGEEEGEADISVAYETGKIIMRMESEWSDSVVGPEPEPEPAEAEVGGRMVSELTVTLNAAGYVEFAEGPIIYYDTDEKGEEYEYDREMMTYTPRYSEGYMTSVSVKNENPDPANLYLQKIDFACHWANGNMTRVDLRETYRDNDGTTTSALTGVAEYESGVKNASCNLDLNWIIVSSDAIARIDDSIMCMMGLCGMRSNYLISRTYDIDEGVNVNDLHYEYQTDSDGYVTAITISQEGRVTNTYTLTY